MTDNSAIWQWMTGLVLAGWVLGLVPAYGQAGDASRPDTAAVDSTAADSAAVDSAQGTSARFDSTGGTSWREDAWNRITGARGVEFSYLFYSKADNHNNGVVIRLQNRNDYPILYDFTVIFRTPTREATAEARGVLRAGQMKTGEKDGLFWIPFQNIDESIGEVGLRGIRIYEIPPDQLEEVVEKYGQT